MNRILFSSANDSWSTPTKVYQYLNKEFSFDFDPCPLGANTAFVESWGLRCFVNPPYSDIRRFMEKALTEIKSGRTELAVFLVPSRTDTSWWHDLVMTYSRDIRFIRGRLKFGDSKNSAPFPSAVIVFRKEVFGEVKKYF